MRLEYESLIPAKRLFSVVRSSSQSNTRDGSNNEKDFGIIPKYRENEMQKWAKEVKRKGEM